MQEYSCPDPSLLPTCMPICINLLSPAILRDVKRIRHNARGRAWRAKNPEKAELIQRNWWSSERGMEKARVRRGMRLPYPGAISVQRTIQLGRCEICGGPGTDLDHCHTTGWMRAWLCHSCNLMLGQARDRVDILRSAALYLDRWSAQHRTWEQEEC